MVTLAAAGTPATLDDLLARQTVWRAGRAPIAAPRGEPTGFDALDALLPQHGWPCAALTELLLPCDGVGELALLLPTLARLTRAGGIVVLVAPPYVPYAPAWRDAGVALSKLHIVDTDARTAPWAIEQALRSGACAAVLGWPQRADAQALRRLQVAAGSGDCLGFVFRDRKHAANPSPASLRLEYVRGGEGGGAWHVRKCRGANAPAQAFVHGADAAGLRRAAGGACDVASLSPACAGEGRREGADRSGGIADLAPASEAGSAGLKVVRAIDAGVPSGRTPSAVALAPRRVEAQAPPARVPFVHPQARAACAPPDAAGH